MIQLRSGDLIGVRNHNAYVLFAILTKQILFGGHWTFVFHRPREALPLEGESVVGPGFNATVDFIVPKREDRVSRISRGNAFATLRGPELLQDPPVRGESNYRIWRWKDNLRNETEYVRFTPSPTREERTAPHAACMPADYVWTLAERGWTPDLSRWDD